MTQVEKLKLTISPKKNTAASSTTASDAMRTRVVKAAHKHESKSDFVKSKVAATRSIFDHNIHVKVSNVFPCPLHHTLGNIINWFIAPLTSGPVATGVLGFIYKTYVLPPNSVIQMNAFCFLFIVAFVLIWLYNACKEQYALISSNSNKISEKNYSIDSITEYDLSEVIEQLPWNLCEPEVESADWVSQILAKYWSLNNAAFKEYINSAIDKSDFFTNFESWLGFSNVFVIKPIKVSLGKRSPEITGVHVLRRGLKRSHVIVDLEITYDGDIDVLLSAFYSLNVAIEHIYARVLLRIIIGPFIRESPTIATTSVTFLKRPVIIWKFNGILRCLNNFLLRSFVEKYLYGLIGNPNKYETTIATYIPYREVSLQEPEGVFRVDVIEAVRLPRLAYFEKPNAYCEVFYENESKKTQIVYGNFHPEWEKSFIFLYTGIQRSFEFYIYDEDIPNDDLIGGFKVSVALFLRTENGYNGRMFSTPVREKETGRLTNNGKTQLCFRISYFELSSNIETLHKSAKLARKNLPLAVLSVLIDYATGLETVAHQIRSPELRFLVRVSVGNQTQVTSIQQRSGYPVWEESLHFFLFDPHLEDVHIEVVDMYYISININESTKEIKNNHDLVEPSRFGTVVGFVTLPVANVINAFEMKTANIYQLEGLVEEGNIRVLTSMRFTVDSPDVIKNQEKPKIKFPEEERPIEEADKNGNKKKH